VLFLQKARAYEMPGARQTQHGACFYNNAKNNNSCATQFKSRVLFISKAHANILNGACK